MREVGIYILMALALVQVIATPFYDFDYRHLGNPQWPAHAKFHCVAYTLLNVGCGLFSLGLLFFHPRLGLWSAGLLGWAAALQMISCLFPGVDPRAGGEKILYGWPVSLWGSLGYLLLVVIAAGFVATSD